MTQVEYIKEFERLSIEEVELTKRKNADYAETGDAFANFKLISEVTCGRVSVEDGILTRMTDKLKRIGGLLGRAAKVTDESIEDTLRDLAVYSKILIIWRRSQMDIKVAKEFTLDDAKIIGMQRKERIHYDYCTMDKDHKGKCSDQRANVDTTYHHKDCTLDPFHGGNCYYRSADFNPSDVGA